MMPYKKLIGSVFALAVLGGILWGIYENYQNKKQEEVSGVKNVQKRILKFIYYPILGVTIISGVILASNTGVFSQDQNNWISLKLGLLIVLIIFGILNGKQIQTDILPKKYAMMVHIPIFLIGAGMIYLATFKPF